MSTDRKKILVTGANGFIGTHVLEQGIRLFPDCDWEATSAHAEKAGSRSWFGKVSSFTEWNYHHASEKPFPFHFSPQDILIHAAWAFLPFFKKEEHLSVELPAQKKFLSLCVQSGLKHLVVLGTCYEYGMQEGCMEEDVTLAKPIMAYPQAKLALYEWLCREYPEIRLVWLRLFYMYGKGQSEKSLIPQLEKAIREKKEFFEMSPGDQIRDYLPVEEMAQLIVKVSLNDHAKGIYNICSGKPIRIIDLVKEYLRKKNVSMKLKTGVYPYPDYEPFAFWGSRKKLDKILESSG